MVTEKLEYVPARVIVLQIVQFKYACPHCEQEAKSPQIELAAKPPEAIEKGMAGPGLHSASCRSAWFDGDVILMRTFIAIRQSTMPARSVGTQPSRWRAYSRRPAEAATFAFAPRNEIARSEPSFEKSLARAAAVLT